MSLFSVVIRFNEKASRIKCFWNSQLTYNISRLIFWCSVVVLLTAHSYRRKQMILSTQILVNIASCNGLLPDDIKLLRDTMLIYHEMCFVVFT